MHGSLPDLKAMTSSMQIPALSLDPAQHISAKMDVPFNQLFRKMIIKTGSLQQKPTPMTSLPQDATRKNTSANRDAGNLFVMDDTLETLKLKHQQDELSFVTQEDLQPFESLLAISAPTDFRHLRTGGQGPLLSSNSPIHRGPTAPNFSRPRRFRPRSQSLPDLSPVSEYSPRLSYYIKETLHNAPEPILKSLSDTIMNATMNNNRLELILDGLGELDAEVQNKLDTYLDNSSSSSGSSPNSTSTGTGNSGLKRLLSRRKCRPPLRRPSPDPFLLEGLRTRLS